MALLSSYQQKKSTKVKVLPVNQWSSKVRCFFLNGSSDIGFIVPVAEGLFL